MELIVFIFGLIVGSFLNVLIYRLPRGLSFAKSRSFCPKCKAKISWYDNIPLLSFVLIRGRCRFCKKPISVRYPAVELLTGVLFFLSYLSHLSFLSYLLFSGLIVIFFTDLKHKIIPDEIVFPLIILFSLRQIVLLFSLSPVTYHLSPILSALGSFGFFLFLYLITKGKGMGFGDVKLAFLMGLVLGFPNVIFALYIAFLTGALTGVILILVGKARLKGVIAFGPFLVTGFVITLFYGQQINRIFQTFFGLYHN